MLKETDVVIVGAGPAGLAAARSSAAAGLRVLLIDENARVGGQITRQPFGGPSTTKDRLPSGVEFMPRTQCIGMVGRGRLAISADGIGGIVQSRATIFATGAVERVYPVPGWTKPGVMTVGAAQSFLKGSGSFPYKRVVIAGTGPLMLAGASQLLRAGVEVVAIVEAARPGGRDLLSAFRVLSGGSTLLEGAGYIADIVKHRVPVLAGKAVTKIITEPERVTGVKVCNVDRDWSVSEHSKAREFECDAVLMSHGFNSAVDLSSQAGAELAWNSWMQTWEPKRDSEFRTTVDSVWAIGDCAGIGGSKVAELEGILAGHSVARALEKRSSIDDRRLRRHLRTLMRFRRGMDEIFRVGSAVPSFATDETIVCRCQAVTAGTLRGAVGVGTMSVHGVKLWTRAGMGTCQGRSCGHSVDAVLSEDDRSTNGPMHSRSRTRFPVRPTSSRVLSDIGALIERLDPV